MLWCIHLPVFSPFLPFFTSTLVNSFVSSKTSVSASAEGGAVQKVEWTCCTSSVQVIEDGFGDAHIMIRVEVEKQEWMGYRQGYARAKF